MKIRNLVMTAMIAALGLLNVRVIQAEDAMDRIEDSNRVLKEIMAAPDKGIPRDLLSKAHCVAVIPALKKAGFVVGAQYGKGVITCRTTGDAKWSGPSTIRIEGGSFGLQIGGSEVDVVLLVMDERGAEKLMKSKFTFGADATAAAGPVGRSAQAQTDAMMHAEILSYSRSRGVFAGLALEGATLRPDSSDNQKIYGREVEHATILQGKVEVPPSAKGLIETLNRYSNRESASSAEPERPETR